MTKKLNKSSKSVAHHTEGRTRLKVPKHLRDSEDIHQVKRALRATPGVTDVDVNQTTGSITVRHEHDEDTIFQILHSAMETVGTDMLTAMIEGESVPLVGGIGVAAAGVGILEGVLKSLFGPAGTGKEVPLFSGDSNDIKKILPAALLGAAIYKAYETKTIWSGVSPLVLGLMALDWYWKLNHDSSAVAITNNGHGHGHEHSEHPNENN